MHFACIRGSFGRDFLIGEFSLVSAQSDAGAPGTIISEGMKQQPSPSAADVEQPVPRPEAQFSADVIELAGLGCVEVFIRSGKISR
jgi:hypothetical protein